MSRTSNGKVALVTGGGQGIGQATVERLHADGFSVVIADLNMDTAGALAEKLGGKEGGAVPLYERMLAQLQAQGHPAANTWAKLTPQAEHNEAAWRADFGAAVQWLFAP